MSFAGHEFEFGRWSPDKVSKKSQEFGTTSCAPHSLLPSSDPGLGPPSFNTLLIQSMTSLLAITLYLLRRYEVPFLGLRVGLVFGTVPIECIMLSTVLLILGIKDVANTLGAFRASTDTEADEKIWTQDMGTRKA